MVTTQLILRTVFQYPYFLKKATCTPVHSMYQTVRCYCLVGIFPKVAHIPKITLCKKHPTNILRKEKHLHGIALALPKPHITFKTIK